MRNLSKKFKRWPKRLSSSGFSLIEVLVTASLFSVLIAVVSIALYTGQETWQTNSVTMELQQELRKAMDWMKDDLRGAGTSSITNVPANGTSYNTITFKIPSGVTNGVITWDSNSIQFSLGGTNNSQLLRTYAGTTKILAQDMQSLQFRRQAATSNILEVTMIAQKMTLKKKTITYQLDFQVRLRN